MAQRFYEEYRKAPNQQRLEFVDVDPTRAGRRLAGPGSPIIEGSVETKLEQLRGKYSGIILADQLDRIPTALVERLVRTQFQRARVYTIESFYESHWRYVPLEAMDPVWPLQTGFQLARMSPYHYLKRVCDLGLAAGLLVICSPLLVILMGLVWITSGRPIFYSQERVGRGGQPFTLSKLRTMVTREVDEPDEIYTRKDDPRITAIGRWLRKLRLDELPQLWNVSRAR
jgi:hypothetical protein